jgi:LmbE family N-acetylglucosaminyl deacetylase
MADQQKTGPFHRSALKILKKINRTIFCWQCRRFRSQVEKKHLQYGLPPRERVLLLAPHMDDEMIGCAGLIAHYHHLGARIVCVYMTDSAADRAGSERRASMAIRMRETKAAGRALGIQQTYFLNQPDGRLRDDPALIEKMKAILEKENPQLLLMPYSRDPHPDHRVTAFLAAKAMPLSGAAGIAPYFFQLRVPIPLAQIDLALDISDFFESKQTLLKGYRSQSQFVFSLALHLQSCQGALLGRACRAVEVFAAAPLDRLAAMSNDGADDGLQVWRHLHVGFKASRWRCRLKPEKPPAHPKSREVLPCS